MTNYHKNPLDENSCHKISCDKSLVKGREEEQPMYPTLQFALNDEHLRELNKMAASSVPIRVAGSRRAGGAVRNATGSVLIALGQRIASRTPRTPRPPLSPVGR